MILRERALWPWALWPPGCGRSSASLQDRVAGVRCERAGAYQHGRRLGLYELLGRLDGQLTVEVVVRIAMERAAGPRPRGAVRLPHPSVERGVPVPRPTGRFGFGVAYLIFGLAGERIMELDLVMGIEDGNRIHPRFVESWKVPLP